MKNVLFILLLVAISSPVFATTFRVNNNPGVDAPYTTFEAAHDAALSWAVVGDTIIVEPSPISYGSVTIFKNVTVIGNGYEYGDLPVPQVNPNYSKFADLTIATNASPGIHLIGLTFDNSISIYGSNVVLTRCRLFQFGGTDLTVSGDNNIIQSNHFHFATISISGDNNILSNNLISNSDTDISNSANNLIIENNVFRIGYNINFDSGYVIFRNNILLEGVATSNYANTLFNNNRAEMDEAQPFIGLFEDNNRYYQVSYLININFGTPNNYDDYEPGPFSENQGYYGNGDDIGMFNDGVGRPTHILNGIPPVPNIYSLDLGGPNGNNLPVTLGTKTNN